MIDISTGQIYTDQRDGNLYEVIRLDTTADQDGIVVTLVWPAMAKPASFCIAYATERFVEFISSGKLKLTDRR